MKKYTHIALLAGLFSLSALISAHSAVLAWYRMEGTPNTTIGTVSNSQGAAVDAVASGAPFQYSKTVKGFTVYDPSTDTAYANGSSMAFSGGTASSQLTVADGTSGTLDVADFTVEMFVRLDSVLGPSSYYLTTHGNAGADGWGIRNNFADNRPHTFVNNMSLYEDDSELLLDGEWHHLALVVSTSDPTPANRFARLYLDYNLIEESNASGIQNYNVGVAGNLLIEAEDYTGFIDEYRFSDSVLTPYQFLQSYTVPEPSSLGLLLMGSLLIGAWRKTR